MAHIQLSWVRIHNQYVICICNMYFTCCFVQWNLWIIAKSHLCMNMRICTLLISPMSNTSPAYLALRSSLHRHPPGADGRVQRGRQRTHKNVPRPCSINYKIGFSVEATPPRLDSPSIKGRPLRDAIVHLINRGMRGQGGQIRQNGDCLKFYNKDGSFKICPVSWLKFYIS